MIYPCYHYTFKVKHSLIFGLGIVYVLFSSIQCHVDLFLWWWKVMLCFNPPLHDHYSFLFLPFSLTTLCCELLFSLLLRLRRISYVRLRRSLFTTFDNCVCDAFHTCVYGARGFYCFRPCIHSPLLLTSL